MRKITPAQVKISLNRSGKETKSWLDYIQVTHRTKRGKPGIDQIPTLGQAVCNDVFRPSELVRVSLETYAMSLYIEGNLL